MFMVIIQCKIFPAPLVKGSQCFQADLRIVGEEPIAIVVEYGFLQDVVQFLYGLGHDECPSTHVIELTDIVGAQACIGAIYEPAVPGHLDDFFFVFPGCMHMEMGMPLESMMSPISTIGLGRCSLLSPN